MRKFCGAYYAHMSTLSIGSIFFIGLAEAVLELDLKIYSRMHALGFIRIFVWRGFRFQSSNHLHTRTHSALFLYYIS